MKRKRTASLVVAPPLTPEQVAEAEQMKQLRCSFRALAQLFPSETARWLVAQTDINIEVQSARFVAMAKKESPPVHPVSQPSGPAQLADSSHEAIAELVVGALKRAAPRGTIVRRMSLDMAAMQHQERAKISRLPFPVVLDATGTLDGQQRQHMLLGVALPPPGDDGSGRCNELVDAIPWYMNACRSLALQDGLGDLEASQQLCHFTVPVYVSPGTGILDPEEAGGPGSSQAGEGMGLLGSILACMLSGRERAECRERILEVIRRRSLRDANRRRAAECRERIFGDRMITDEQLRELHNLIDDDAPYLPGLHLQWASVRLWEQDAHQLVKDLPVELLGLAMLAAPGIGSREEVLEKAMWRLRGLGTRTNFERCLVPLAAMARVYVPDDCSSPIILRAAKPFWGGQ